MKLVLFRFKMSPLCCPSLEFYTDIAKFLKKYVSNRPTNFVTKYLADVKKNQNFLLGYFFGCTLYLYSEWTSSYTWGH